MKENEPAPGRRCAATLARAVAVMAAFFVAFEWTARRAGALDPTERADPYLGLAGTSELYRLEERPGGALRARSPNKPLYREAEFEAAKPGGEFRVFCVGGSAVRSADFMSPDGSFPHYLEVLLRGAMGKGTPRVINAGGGGAGSAQYLEVVREVLGYQPDLLVVYPEGGERNLVASFAEGDLLRRDEASPLRAEARRALAKSRLYALAREIVSFARRDPEGDEHGFGAPRYTLAIYLENVLRRPFVADSFSRLFEFKQEQRPRLLEGVLDRAELTRAHERLRSNLVGIARLAAERGVPVLFVAPARNHRATFYLRSWIDPAEVREGAIEKWRDLYDRALLARSGGGHEEAVAALRAVRALYRDDRDDLLAMLLGDSLERLGRIDEAREEYALPDRRHPIHGILDAVARETGCPLVSPAETVAWLDRDGIPGYGEFTDSFHPLPRANVAIAKSILHALRKHGIGPPLLERDAPSAEQASGIL